MVAYEIKSGEPFSFRFPGLDFLMCLEFSGNISTVGLTKAFAFINRKALNHIEEFRRLIVQSDLREWRPLSDEHRRQIADIAINAALESLQRIPRSSGHNYINIRFDVSDHEEIDEDDYVLDDDDQGVIINMVPATELSIGNLERKKPRVSGSGSGCPVCLEDFSIDCEVVHMPCSHGFHGDCIEKWLRESHYCPLCRFEMPTN